MGPIDIVRCHAEGEVGDVIVGGVDTPPGAAIWDQARWIESDGRLRDFVLNEPRGGVFRHVNLLVPPVHPDADLGFIIMEPEHTPPMSGSNAICVATVALNTGLVPMTEPETHLTLEAPGGLVKVFAECDAGQAHRIRFENVPSFAVEIDARLELDEVGALEVDTAYGGDSFVLVDARQLGFDLVPSEAAELAALGARITQAANDQLQFDHPEREWNHFSFTLLAGPLEGDGGRLTMKNTCVIDPGKLDRSPTGTGLSARMAVLRARGLMEIGDTLTMRSIIDSEFEGQIVAETSVGDRAAIVPSVSGRAWITGTAQLVLDPRDPWPRGYRVADTWPNRTT